VSKYNSVLLGWIVIGHSQFVGSSWVVRAEQRPFKWLHVLVRKGTINPKHACLESLLFCYHRASLPQSPLAP